VIIGILYRICLHQTPSNRIPAALRQTPSDWIHVVLWQTPSDWIHAVLWQTLSVGIIVAFRLTISDNKWPRDCIHVVVHVLWHTLWQDNNCRTRATTVLIRQAIVPFLLRLQRRTCRWMPWLLSVESSNYNWKHAISGWPNEWMNITSHCFIKLDSRYLYEHII
jgi:hypothetical protein